MKRLILASMAATFSLAPLAAPAMAQNYYYYVVPTNPNAQVSSAPSVLFDPLMAERQQAQQLQNELLRQQIELQRLRLQQQQR